MPAFASGCVPTLPTRCRRERPSRPRSSRAASSPSRLGRPERTSTLSGRATGYLPGAADPGAEFTFRLTEGSAGDRRAEPGPALHGQRADRCQSRRPRAERVTGQAAQGRQLHDDAADRRGPDRPDRMSGPRRRCRPARSAAQGHAGRPTAGSPASNRPATIIGVSYSDGTEARLGHHARARLRPLTAVIVRRVLRARRSP